MDGNLSLPNDAVSERVTTERQLPAAEYDITTLNATTSVERGERRPSTDTGGIVLDNNMLNKIDVGGIVNMVVPTPQLTQNAVSLTPFSIPTTYAPPPTTSSSNLYLQPIDLLVSVDSKTKQSTVMGAIPSRFAVNSLQQLPSVPYSALTQLTSVPQSPWLPLPLPTPTPSQPTSMGLPSVPLPSIPMASIPMPSIPLMATLNSSKSTLNPSAATFTPFTPNTPIAPIIEQNVPEIDEFEITTNQSNGHTELNQNQSVQPPIAMPDASPHTSWLELDPQVSAMGSDEGWSRLDEDTQDSTEGVLPTMQRKVLSPSFKRNPSMDARTTSFRHTHRRKAFLNDNNGDVPKVRDFRKNWRSSTPKTPSVTMSPRCSNSPRWRGKRKAVSPPKSRAMSKQFVYKTEVTKNPVGVVKKDTRLLVDFVRHVTLGNRQEYPPNKLLTKTWAMKNVSEVEWGNDVELVYVKGDLALTLHKRYPVINAQPGQEVEVSVSLKTPATPGRMCAYFRLEKKGKLFGPRVWADVIVTGDFKDNTRQVACRLDDKMMPNKMKWKKVVSVK